MTQERKTFLWGNELPGPSSVLNSPQRDAEKMYQYYCYKYRSDPKYNDLTDQEISDGAWRRACTFVKCRDWTSKVSFLLHGVSHDLIYPEYLMGERFVQLDQEPQQNLGRFWHCHGYRSEGTYVHHTHSHYVIDTIVPEDTNPNLYSPPNASCTYEIGSITSSVVTKISIDDLVPCTQNLASVLAPNASCTHEVGSVTSSVVTRISIDDLVPCTHKIAPVTTSVVTEISLDHLAEELTASEKLVDYLEDNLDLNKKQMDYLMDDLAESKKLLADPNLFGFWGEYRDVEGPAADGSLI